MLAVITGDLINSTNYGKALRKSVLSALNEEFSYIKTKYRAEFTIFRGDSFQGVVDTSKDALRIVLLLKTAVIKASGEQSNKKPVSDVRISIGIGEADYIENAVAESSGEAFYLSGKTLDLMKNQEKTISLKTAFDEINQEFNVHLMLLDTIVERWSTASAEVVYYLLKGYKQQEIASIIGRSQAAVNLRKKAANWDEISVLLQRYEKVISEFYIQ